MPVVRCGEFDRFAAESFTFCCCGCFYCCCLDWGRILSCKDFFVEEAIASCELLIVLALLTPTSFVVLLVDGSTREPFSFFTRLCSAGDWKPPT